VGVLSIDNSAAMWYNNTVRLECVMSVPELRKIVRKRLGSPFSRETQEVPRAPATGPLWRLKPFLDGKAEALTRRTIEMAYV
jgi:hypothetical protein